MYFSTFSQHSAILFNLKVKISPLGVRQFVFSFSSSMKWAPLSHPPCFNFSSQILQIYSIRQTMYVQQGGWFFKYRPPHECSIDKDIMQYCRSSTKNLSCPQYQDFIIRNIYLKRQCHETFRPLFIKLPGPLINRLKLFYFRGDIHEIWIFCLPYTFYATIKFFMDICQEFIVFILRSCTLYLNFLTVSSVCMIE